MNRRSVKLAGVLTLVSALLAIPQTVAADPAAAPAAAVEHTADSRLSDATLPVDRVTLDECAKHPMNGETIWFKNRYSICQKSVLDIIYTEIRNGVRVPIGASSFDITFIGVAVENEHKVKFDMRAKYFGSSGKPLMNSVLSFAFECDNNDHERASTCDYTAAPVALTVAQWASPGGDEPFGWTATTATTAVPTADKYREELRGFFAFDLKSKLVGPDGHENSGPVVDKEYFRCDSAAYVTRGSRCVFTSVTPTMVFELNSDHGQSADFIKGAQEGRQDIVALNPQLAGKKVPGKFGESKLRYLSPRYDFDNSKKGSRAKVRRVCIAASTLKYTRDENGNVRQCDEYPFASTYQNSAKVDESTEWSFAAKAIAETHNNKGGQLIADWYAREHMLDDDGFYVVVR